MTSLNALLTFFVSLHNGPLVILPSHLVISRFRPVPAVTANAAFALVDFPLGLLSQKVKNVNPSDFFSRLFTTHVSVATVHAPFVVVPLSVARIKPGVSPHVGTGEGLLQRCMTKGRGNLK